MQEWMNKNINKIVAIFLLLQPILDLLTGVCVNTFHMNITIGIIIRVLFLAIMCFIVLFIFKKKHLVIPYLIIGLYFVFYTVGMIIYKDSNLLTEIQNLVRVFYFPILLLSLYSIRDKIRISNLTLLTMVLLYIIFIFIPTILGVGYKSYQITKAGTLGFYNSANEISGIISILTPIMFVIFYKSKKIVPLVIYSIMYLVVILMIGTKTPLLTLGITGFISLIYYWRYAIKEKKFKQLFISLVVIIVGCVSLVIIIPKTNFYKNIKTHLNYLGLEHVTEVFKDKDLVDHFIFSSRLKFMSNKAFLYRESSTYEKIFGMGYINDEKETKLIEMDYFDIYYSHGLVGFVVFFLIVLIILYKILEDRVTKGYENGMKLLSLFLIIFLAFFTGHIITAPAVSYIVIIMILSLWRRDKKDLLFTGYNLGVGGIEKAQVNLLDNIDYDKYNVALVLEKKEGELLDKINKNVDIRELKVSENKDVLIRKFVNATRKLIFKVFEYDNYDFSCCYTTYSYSGNKLAKIASFNNAFYVHSDYRQVYSEESEFREFFDSRGVSEYKKIIFVSKESEKSFTSVYPELKDKTMVLNNFIDISDIKAKSKEVCDKKKKKSTTLFVFVGRLDDSSKKLTRAIHLIKEIKNSELWIVGDGPDRNLYEEEVKKEKLENKITFLGKKINPYPYMKEADYILLTSDYEGFPVTYLEAIVLDKDILTTIPTSDDSIDMKKYAHIISKDEKEMVKEVKKILKEKPTHKKMDLEKIQEFRKSKLEILFND